MAAEEEESVEETIQEESPPPVPKRPTKRVLVTNQQLPGEAIALLQSSFEVHFLPDNGDDRLFVRYSQGMDGILLDNPSLTLDQGYFRAGALGLKSISIVGWSVGKINLKEAAKRKVKIGICPSDLAVDSAAEVAVGAAIFLCRRMKEGNFCLQRGTTDLANPMWLLGRCLTDCTCGILGLGKLGSSIAVRLKNFWPKRIVYYSRRVNPIANRLSIERILFKDLLEVSDLLFLCVPYNETTEEMFDQRTFSKMKRGSIVINSSHGGLVRINDLYCALRKGVLSGAASDTDLENAPSPKHPINMMDNFIMLPNVGRSSATVRIRMYMTAIRNLISGLTEKKMLYPYPPANQDIFVETEEERVIREAEEKQRLEELQERLRIEKELRLKLEEEQRLQLEKELLERENNKSIPLEEEEDNQPMTDNTEPITDVTEPITD